ncbi:MAG TPA: ADP-ribosylglycohydrolase family protein [Acidobacteriota bacterium]
MSRERDPRRKPQRSRPAHPFARPKPPPNPQVEQERSRAAGLLLGLACGDAMGYPIERKPLARIREHYGRSGIQDLPRDARFSDDTQQAVAVAEALARVGAASAAIVLREVAWELLNWARSPESNRAPDPDSIHGARQLERGLRAAPDPAAVSAAVLVRVLPVGYFYAGRAQERDQLAAAVARLTHGHPVAIEAAVLAAQAADLAGREPPSSWLSELQASCTRAELRSALELLVAAERVEDADLALQRIGEGWDAASALALALYVVRRHPDDLRAGIARAVNFGGDSDTVGALVGGLLGLRLGAEAVPPPWLRRLEKSTYLQRLAAALARRRGATLKRKGRLLALDASARGETPRLE